MVTKYSKSFNIDTLAWTLAATLANEIFAARQLMRPRSSARQVLLAVVALATTRNIDSLSVGMVGSFPELKLAIGSGTPTTIEITSPEIVFDHQLDFRSAGSALLIESTIYATLSGGNRTRLFSLHNCSKLSLRGVVLANGLASGRVASGQCSECSNGGAIFVATGSALCLHSVHLFNNRADYGGAIYSMNSSIAVTDCTMISNLAASRGGAVATVGDSALTVMNCTILSNSASVGGGLAASDASVVVATDCTMTSNLASSWGGAVRAADNTVVTATNCAINSNSATLGGGAILAAGHSSGIWGGAVLAVENTVVTATDCTMTSNSATWGGAVSVGGDTRVATADSTVTLANCALALNTAHSDGGAAIFAGVGGTVDLVNSVLQSNATDDGVPIVNWYGQVECDTITGCPRVCTLCQDEEDMLSLPPTSRPTAQVTTTSQKREPTGSASTLALVALSALCLLVPSVIAVTQLCRFKFGRNAHRSGDEGNNDGLEINLLQSPLMDMGLLEWPRAITAVDINDAAAEHSANHDVRSPAEVEELSNIGNRVSLPWSAIESSPGFILAIDREMRVVSWSQGAICVVVVTWQRHSPALIRCALHLFRDVCLCPVGRRPTRSASRGASLRAHACERPVL